MLYPEEVNRKGESIMTEVFWQVL